MLRKLQRRKSKTSQTEKSSYQHNRKLYVEVMVENKLVPVWANHFKMKKVGDE